MTRIIFTAESVAPTGYENAMTSNHGLRVMGVTIPSAVTVDGKMFSIDEIIEKEGWISDGVRIKPGVFQDIELAVDGVSEEFGTYCGISRLEILISSCRQYMVAYLHKPDGREEEFALTKGWRSWEPRYMQCVERHLAALDSLLAEFYSTRQ